MPALALPRGISCMRIATGTVISGKVVVQGEALPEGTVVTIIAREPAERFVIPPELEPELTSGYALPVGLILKLHPAMPTRPIVSIARVAGSETRTGATDSPYHVASGTYSSMKLLAWSTAPK